MKMNRRELALSLGAPIGGALGFLNTRTNKASRTRGHREAIDHILNQNPQNQSNSRPSGIFNQGRPLEQSEEVLKFLEAERKETIKKTDLKRSQLLKDLNQPVNWADFYIPAGGFVAGGASALVIDKIYEEAYQEEIAQVKKEAELNARSAFNTGVQIGKTHKS